MTQLLSLTRHSPSPKNPCGPSKQLTLAQRYVHAGNRWTEPQAGRILRFRVPHLLRSRWLCLACPKAGQGGSQLGDFGHSDSDDRPSRQLKAEHSEHPEHPAISTNPESRYTRDCRGHSIRRFVTLTRLGPLHRHIHPLVLQDGILAAGAKIPPVRIPAGINARVARRHLQLPRRLANAAIAAAGYP